MRWDWLFNDLEAQLQAQREAELRGEVLESLRVEQATETLEERYLKLLNHEVVIELGHSLEITGMLSMVGERYLCVEEQTRNWLLTTRAIRQLRLTAHEPSPSDARPRLSTIPLATLIRAVMRNRSRVQALDVDGRLLAEGTLSQVGKDFVQIAQHARDEFAREQSITTWNIIPLAALGALNFVGDF